MNSSIAAAIIGALGTILGGIIGRLDVWDRLMVRNKFPSLAGTKWESTWEDPVDGVIVQKKELFEFTTHKRDRVYGFITMEEYPQLRWEIEGVLRDRFLQLFWYPSKKSVNKFFLDYGCYFFERQGTGSFKGYGVGFDAHQNQIDFGEHTLQQII